MCRDKEDHMLRERFVCFSRDVRPVWDGKRVYLLGVPDMDRVPWVLPDIGVRMLSDLTHIPRIMRSRGWMNGARLFEIWCSRSRAVAPRYATPDTTIIRMDR